VVHCRTVQKLRLRSPNWNFFNPLTCLTLHTYLSEWLHFEWNSGCLIHFVFSVTFRGDVDHGWILLILLSIKWE